MEGEGSVSTGDGREVKKKRERNSGFRFPSGSRFPGNNSREGEESRRTIQVLGDTVGRRRCRSPGRGGTSNPMSFVYLYTHI